MSALPEILPWEKWRASNRKVFGFSSQTLVCKQITQSPGRNSYVALSEDPASAGSSQVPVTPVLRDLTPSLAPLPNQACDIHINMQGNHTHTHKS